MYTYIYKITRHGELTSVVTSNVFSDKEKDVMNFYKREISEEDKRQIIEAYNAGKLGDTFEYIKDNLVERDSTRSPCRYKELMGARDFFEGLEETEPNTFYVCLGS